MWDILKVTYEGINESKERGASKNIKRRAKQENSTLLGKIMIIHPLTHHQWKMKKPIYD